MRKLAEGFVKAEVEMIGNPELIPGHLVNLDKLGAEIDGTYRVEHARHQFSKHGYSSWLKMVRIAKKSPARAQQPKPAPAQQQTALQMSAEVIEPPHLETEAEVHPPPHAASPAEVPLEDLESTPPESEAT